VAATHRNRWLALAIPLVMVASGCQLQERFNIGNLRDGEIVAGPTVLVTGTIKPSYPVGGTLEISGVPTTYADIGVDPNRSWSATIPADAAFPVTEVQFLYTTPGSVEYREIKAVINGNKRVDNYTPAGYSTDGVGMRFTNAGLIGLGPVINNLAAGSFDVAALLAGQPVNSDQATGTVTDASVGNIGFSAQSTASGVRAITTLSDMTLGINLNVSTLGIGFCRLEVDVPSVTIDGYYDLRPDPADATVVDVNLKGGTPGALTYEPLISIPTINHEFTDGTCDPDTFAIGGLVSGLAGNSIPGTIRSSFNAQLKDPDGAGPNDAVIADAVETALSGISISGAVGGAVGAHLDSPLVDITEDAGGLTFRSNAAFGNTVPVTNVPTCPTPAHAPTLEETFDLATTFPTLGGTTPTGGVPYGLGLVISSSAFNQMIGAMAECGLLNSDISELSPGQPLTSEKLVNFGMPIFGKLGSPKPMVIRVRPTAGPFLTGNTGPNGEPNELFLGNLMLDFVQMPAYDPISGDLVHGELTWLSIAIDAPMGFDLAYDPIAKELKPTITAPAAADVRARVARNMIGAKEANAEFFFPTLFPKFAAGVTDTFAAFPLPEFLGLSLNVLEVNKTANNAYVLYTNLEAAPAVSISGLTINNTSPGRDTVDASVFDSHEWVSRIRKTWSTSSTTTRFQSGTYADACCFADDERIFNTGSYNVNFTVNPAIPGGAWQVDLGQTIAGALTVVNDGGSTARGEAKVGTANARVQVNGGGWTNFNITPSATGLRTSNSANTPFSGSSSTRVSGSGAATIRVEFSMYFEAFSDSTGLFSGSHAGDEAGVRFGHPGTLGNGVTVDDYAYPYTGGNRNPATDGSVITTKACTPPLVPGPCV